MSRSGVDRAAPAVSFRDFVDDALFHPRWGYYSTGRVRFGEGGHYETFPLALSPLFGQMVARCAFRFWQRSKQPPVFELCELGAGNGQLCVDVLAYLHGTMAGVTRPKTRAWNRFAHTLRYHIVERSAALIARQRAQLGPLIRQVRWTRADLSARSTRHAPFAQHGFIIANEVLDCLAHHQIVATANGPGVVFVMPPTRTGARAHGPTGAPKYVERILPLSKVPELRPFLEQHCPEVFARRTFPPYFACPAIATLITNSARLYARCEAFWIDYGEERRFHLRTPAHKRVFAGPTKSGASVYDRPGYDDITFMVDFSVAQSAARAAGQRVVSYGHQRDLARYARVRFDAAAADLIARSRAVTWLLAVSGVGPERGWRQTGLTWKRSAARGGSVASSVRRSIDEFLGRRRSAFKLLVLRSGKAA